MLCFGVSLKKKNCPGNLVSSFNLETHVVQDKGNFYDKKLSFIFSFVSMEEQ